MIRLRTLSFALALAGAAITTALAQGNFGPPVGVPFGRSFGPPSGTVDDFLGTWKLTWSGNVGTNCPCHGVLTIEEDGNGALIGYWETRSGTYQLRGRVGYDQNTWTGRFEKPNDLSDWPIKGEFRLMSRDERTLTGSYQPTGAAIGFPLNGSR
jgi:hypothetical protein